MAGQGRDPVASVTLGRDAELGALFGLLDAAGGGVAATVLLRGEPGSGKTHLATALAHEARASGWVVLSAIGVESEMVLPGSGLLSVLGPLRDDLSTLPGAQAAALASALGWGDPAQVRADRFLVGAATLALLSAAAARGPVLVTVDDLQWVDDESADALAFASRRLVHDRVAIVFTQRDGARLAARMAGIDVIELDGLSAGAARELLGSGFSTEVAARLAAETAGNPLALVECRRVMGQAQRTGAAPLPPTLPVPERLRAVFVDELAALAPGAWRAATLCAALADADLAPVLAALGDEGLDAEKCLAGADDVLVVDAGSVLFRHPLLRATTWQRASRSERLSAHASLAAALPDGAARTWHRAEAATSHDGPLAADLALVAESDRSRTGFAAASRAMERAAQLTPVAARRHEWLAEATEDALLAGDTARARRLASAVLASDAGPAPRAKVAALARPPGTGPRHPAREPRPVRAGGPRRRGSAPDAHPRRGVHVLPPP